MVEKSNGKKTIKLFTYVDEGLNARFQDFMTEFQIPNQAKAIRTCIESYLKFADLIKLKKSMVKDDIDQNVDEFIEKAIANYNKMGQDFLQGLKSRLSPLKTSLLMCSQVQENPEKLRNTINTADLALTEIENYIAAITEGPNPRRFMNTFDILHVEDNDLERKTITDYFELQGKSIKSVERAEEAIEILKSATPRAILIDVNLATSNMNGDSLCKMLKAKEEYALIPIYLITAIGSPSEKDEILKETGADDVLFKPINSLTELDMLLHTR